jgi:hypothetical protein
MPNGIAFEREAAIGPVVCVVEFLKRDSLFDLMSEDRELLPELIEDEKAHLFVEN